MDRSAHDERLRRDEAGDAFESAWERGERPRIEAFLADCGGPERIRRFRHLLAIEVERRRAAGDPPIAEEYLARFPDLRAAIAEVVPAAVGSGTSTVPDPFPGEFRVLAILGRGGFGEVWLAEEISLGRLVALKTIRHRDRRADHARERALQALRNDAIRLARLRHPHLVQVLTWREKAAEHYLVLEYVAGGSFADRLRWSGPLDWSKAVRYVAGVGDGLRAVHQEGLIHRDIKPANILWDPRLDEARLTDFGLATLPGDDGGFAGTLAYMAPEALRGRPGPESDVYGLSASLFELLTGSRPHPGPGPADYLEQSDAGLPPGDDRLQDVPEVVVAAVRGGLEPSVSRRLSLPVFLDSLRSALNCELADRLEAAPGQPAVRIALAREIGPDRFEPLSEGGPGYPIRLWTGDRIRADVAIERDGFLSVFNLGPTGNLNRLLPERPDESAIPVRAGTTLPIIDVELTDPNGPERLCVLWTRHWPAGHDEDRLRQLTMPAGIATRDLKRIGRRVGELETEDRHVRVIAIDHRPGPRPTF